MSWLNTKLLGNRYVGIEHFTSENEDYAAIVLIRKKTGELEIVGQNIVNATETHSGDHNKQPHFITINTNQVIQKEVEGSNAADEKLVRKVFPNIALEEFYYETCRLKSQSIVAICRKKYVEDLLKSYESQGVYVAGVGLGICAIAGIIDLSLENELQTNTHCIQIASDATVLSQIQRPQHHSYDINGITIDSQSLLAFAGTLRLFGSPSVSGNLSQYNTAIFGKFEQSVLFSKAIKTFTGILLVLLLINFLTFTHYYKKAQEVSNNLSRNQSAIAVNNAVADRIRMKEVKVKTLASSRNSVSLIINEIAVIVPTSVTLTELSFNPLQKKVKPEEPILTTKKVILASGIISDNTAFTNWIEKIGKMNEVAAVTIVNFGKNEDNETGFSIKIALR